jgi:hypothetical protein
VQRYVTDELAFVLVQRGKLPATPVAVAAWCALKDAPARLERLRAAAAEAEDDALEWTAMHAAAALGECWLAHVATAEPGGTCAAELLTQPDTRGRTPLHIAASLGHASFIKALLYAPLPVGGRAAAMCVPDCDGRTPLHCAAANGHGDAASALLDMDTTNDSGPASLRRRADARGHAAVHLAWKRGSFRLALRMLPACQLAGLHVTAVVSYVLQHALPIVFMELRDSWATVAGFAAALFALQWADARWRVAAWATAHGGGALVSKAAPKGSDVDDVMRVVGVLLL